MTRALGMKTLLLAATLGWAVGCQDNASRQQAEGGAGAEGRDPVVVAQERTEQAYDQARAAQQQAIEQYEEAREAQAEVEQKARELQQAQAEATQQTQEAQQAQQKAQAQTQKAARQVELAQQQAMRAQQQQAQEYRQEVRQRQQAAQAQLEEQQRPVQQPQPAGAQQTAYGTVESASDQEVVLRPATEANPLRLSIDQTTRIFVDGQQVGIDSLQDGAQVRASYVPTGQDGGRALRIEARTGLGGAGESGVDTERAPDGGSFR